MYFTRMYTHGLMPHTFLSLPSACHTRVMFKLWVVCTVVSKANSFAMLNNNIANHYGRSIFACNNSIIVLKGNCSVQFNNNVAKFGGALYIETNSGFTITESPLW